jgi:hypothetical protein
MQVMASDSTMVPAEYAYDALGRRISPSIPAAPASPPVVTWYYHDGHSVTEERDGSDRDPTIAAACTAT